MAEKRTPVRNVITFRNSQGEKARGTLMKLTRSTVVLEVYNPYSIVQLSEVLEDLTIYRGDRVVYDGRAVVSNLVNTGLMLIVSATLEDSWKDLSSLLVEGEGIREEVEQFVDDWKAARHLRSGYQLAVSDLRSFLMELSRWLEQVDMLYGERITDQEREHGIYEEMQASIMPHLKELYIHFEEEAGKITDDELARHKMFVQHELHPLMLQAPFVHRTYSKPLGYAGDYEMMNMIQRDAAEGPNIYAKTINTLFTRIPIAISVINRTQTLVEYLTQLASQLTEREQRLTALSVGCGPAVEIQRFIREEPLSEGCRFRLLDFSKETLEYAEKKINEAKVESNRKVYIETIHKSVHTLLRQAVSSKESHVTGRYDLVYCSGLFDYLSDKVCSRLLRLFYSWVRPGGVVFATNMHVSNRYRYALEHIVEWYLIYRDEAQMARFVPGLGKQRLYVDSTGVNLCIEILKPEGAER